MLVTKMSLFEELILKIKESDTKIVLLGESAHGVFEQNRARVEIIKQLHERLGFSRVFIESAVEQKEPILAQEAVDVLKREIHEAYHTQEVLELVNYILNSNMTLEGFEISGSDLDEYKELKNKINNDGRESRSFRDLTMFKNFEKQFELKFKNEKVIIWGHNAHLMKKTSSGAARDKVLGEFLFERYDSKSFAVGQFLGSGKIEHMPNQKRESVAKDNSIESFIMQNVENISVSSELSDSIFNEKITHSFCHGDEIEELVLSDHFDALILHRECSSPKRI